MKETTKTKEEEEEESHPVAEVVREDEVAGKGVGERVVKVEHLEKLVPLDGVQVAVGQSPHVSRRLSDGPLLPERVPKDVAFTCRKPRQPNGPPQ